MAGKHLLDAAQQLSMHRTEIEAAWRKRLKLFEPCAPHLDRLLQIDPPAYVRYPESAAQHGYELAGHGAPVECAAAALMLYFESSLPFLEPAWTPVFARYMLRFAFALLSGYSRHEREALDAERRRLSQDLHDETGHDLIVLGMYIETIAHDIRSGDLAKARRKLRDTSRLIQQALATVRRITSDLGPATHHKPPFLHELRSYLRQFSRRTAIRTQFDTERLRLPVPVRFEEELSKVLQGALANVAAHARADAVRVTLWNTVDTLGMTIEDDGKGFDVGRQLGKPRESFGLRAIRDRIGRLGGEVEFDSQPRRGTRIEVQLPLTGDGNA